VRIGGTRIGVDGVAPQAADRVLNLGIRAGSVRALGRAGGGVLVSARLAADHGWHLGSIVPVGFTEVGATRRLPVVGVFSADRLFGSEVILPLSLVEQYFPLNRGMADLVLVRAAPKVSPAALHAAVQPVLAAHPDVTVRDRAAYQRERAGDLGDLGGALGLLTALVLLAVAVAILGIANTLALAVFERTREFGMLRAVGMTARQLGAMVRWEAAIIAVSGALVGTAVGVGLGAALASAITVQQAGVATIVLPARQLMVDLALASAAGLIAAAIPARRAARLSPLTAIAVE
jgi:putative ABC transport system permease protein